MHELAICQDIIMQVEKLAAQHNASAVVKIILDIGPLSGVEKDLLAAAFPIAGADSLAASAELQINVLPVVVRCNLCHTESTVPANSLTCNACGSWQTTLQSGDEMLLKRIEMDT